MFLLGKPVPMAMADFLSTLPLLSHQLEGIKNEASISAPDDKLTQAAAAFAGNDSVSTIPDFRSTLAYVCHRLEDSGYLVSTGFQ